MMHALLLALPPALGPRGVMNTYTYLLPRLHTCIHQTACMKAD